MQIEERTADGSALRTQGGKKVPAATASDVFPAPNPAIIGRTMPIGTRYQMHSLAACIVFGCHALPPTLALVFCFKAAFHYGEIAAPAADSSLLLLDIICLWFFSSSTVAGSGSNSSCIAAFLVAGTNQLDEGAFGPRASTGLLFLPLLPLLLFFTFIRHSAL